MNILMAAINIIVVFGIVVLIEKIFKKEGLIAWVSIATITANLTVGKIIDIFGMTTTLGNILFASNFLATDILVEKYSVKDSKKAIYLGLFSQIVFLIITQLSLLYIPSSEDVMQDILKNMFSINLRVSIASMLMFFLSNMLDIYLFEKLKKKYPKKLWIRNNVSTIVSTCLENYVFNTLAFIGIYNFSTILGFATTVTIVEIIIAICDTPFLYLSKKLK